jgi:hypothetical protein
MPIWGWVCSGLVALAALWLVYAVIAEAAEDRRYRREATPVLGWIVQANSALFAPGAIARPAQILVAFDAPASGRDEHLAELARRVAVLKGTDPSDPVEAEVARLVNDESYKPFKRFRLPDAFTGGRAVYSMHIWVERDKLPGKQLTLPFVRCLVYPDRPDTKARITEYLDSDFDHPGSGPKAPGPEVPGPKAPRPWEKRRKPGER